MAQKRLFCQWWWWHRMETILFSLHHLWIRKFTQENNISIRLLSPTCTSAVMQVNAVLFPFKPTYTSALASFHFMYLHIWGHSLFKWLQWLLQILCLQALSTVLLLFRTGWQIMSRNNICINVPSSQTFRSYFNGFCWTKSNFRTIHSRQTYKKKMVTGRTHKAYFPIVQTPSPKNSVLLMLHSHIVNL
jgi:hypothetical protein